jgi:two-component system, OmpR family, KDP operon response regulator KdpE
MRILLVDDEAAIRRFLRASLSAHGHAVYEAANGQKALDAVAATRPDLIILDLGLPDIDGVDVLRQLRTWSPTPVIVLSVLNEVASKIEALDAGADDYVTKPFAVGELLARVRVAVRHRAPEAADGTLHAGRLVIDLTRRVVTNAGDPVQLTPTEYSLLRVLVTHAGKVLTHRYLLREVWGVGHEADAHLLRVNISNLRRKIEPEPARPQLILNEPGVGYRVRE